MQQVIGGCPTQFTKDLEFYTILDLQSQTIWPHTPNLLVFISFPITSLDPYSYCQYFLPSFTSDFPPCSDPKYLYILHVQTDRSLKSEAFTFKILIVSYCAECTRHRTLILNDRLRPSTSPCSDGLQTCYLTRTDIIYPMCKCLSNFMKMWYSIFHVVIQIWQNCSRDWILASNIYLLCFTVTETFTGSIFNGFSIIQTVWVPSCGQTPLTHPEPVCIVADLDIPAVSPWVKALGAQDTEVIFNPLWVFRKPLSLPTTHTGQMFRPDDMHISSVWVQHRWSVGGHLLHLVPDVEGHVAQVFGHFYQSSWEWLWIILQRGAAGFFPLRLCNWPGMRRLHLSAPPLWCLKELLSLCCEPPCSPSSSDSSAPLPPPGQPPWHPLLLLGTGEVC